MGVTSPELLSFIAVLGSEKAGEYFSMPTVERRELEQLLRFPSPCSGPDTNGGEGSWGGASGGLWKEVGCVSEKGLWSLCQSQPC